VLLGRRAAILRIKQATTGEGQIHGIDVYRAVLDDGVRTVSEFRDWLAEHGASDLTHWRPGSD
jgi:hypothetical protein